MTSDTHDLDETEPPSFPEPELDSFERFDDPPTFDELMERVEEHIEQIENGDVDADDYFNDDSGPFEITGYESIHEEPKPIERCRDFSPHRRNSLTGVN